VLDLTHAHDPSFPVILPHSLADKAVFGLPALLYQVWRGALLRENEKVVGHRTT
jgi:hypothetical protein